MLNKKIFILPFALLVSFTLISCTAPSETPTTDTPTVDDTPLIKTFTLEELAQYNGKDGQPAYVAINGVVYDVTDVSEWADGMHKNGLTAGQDLSTFINSAPHGTSVLQSLPIVGELAE